MMPTLEGPARPVTINPPVDPALAQAWRLAVAKFEAAEGREPITRADWRAVVAEYDRISAKVIGRPIGLIREVCADQPGGT